MQFKNQKLYIVLPRSGVYLTRKNVNEKQTNFNLHEFNLDTISLLSKIFLKMLNGIEEIEEVKNWDGRSKLRGEKSIENGEPQGMHRTLTATKIIIRPVGRSPAL